MPEDSAPARNEPSGVEFDDVAPSRHQELVPVIALGGSAGAIEALQAFFEDVPAECPVAFVVAVHLDPGRDSALAELIGRRTRLSVLQLDRPQPVRPGTVYVIPPRKLIRVEEGALALEEREPGSERLVTVDLLFRTLADSHGAHSAAVVLSGADGDGSIGIKRVKERGGLTVAQNPEECKHPAMPRRGFADS